MAREVSPRAVSGIEVGSLLLFLLMSLIWGASWVAIKAGVTAVPPVFFAGLRFGLVAVLLVVGVRGWTAPFGARFARRTVLTGLLVNAGTYSLLFWGIQFVDSGIAGLINLALVPIGLFAFSILVGDERPSWRHALILVLGAAGLLVLFGDNAALTGDGMERWGALAIVAGTACYCIGTVLSRPLLETFAPLQLTAAHAIVGAAGLLGLAIAFEPLSGETARALLAPALIASLLFLAVFGTVIAYTIYLKLVRDWGASRAGLYPFISPVVALLLGWLLFEEQIGAAQIAGAALMLGAAALAIERQARAKSCAAC